MMKIIELSELKSVQLHIIETIHNFCESYNINYSLGYGSLLGAIRHQGFIPWDDDIDIIMPRSDYNRFITDFNSFDKRYQVRHYTNFNDYPFPFAKVEDTKTIKDELGYKGLGIAIDVFPIDNIPDSYTEAKSLLKKCRLLILMNQFKFLRWDSNRPLYRNILISVIKIPLKLFSFKKLNIQHDKLSVKYNSIQTNNAGCLIAFYSNREIMHKNIFSNYTYVTFENLTLKIIQNYDKYLTNLYGDYMQLPPKEKRTTHHDFQAFWK